MSDDAEIAAAADAVTAALTAERQWPVVVKLRKPVTFGSEIVDSLQFRRGRIGDLKGTNIDAVPPVDQLLMIASRMCGRPVKVLEQLEDEDGAEVIELALSFFARCLVGGKTLSRS